MKKDLLIFFGQYRTFDLILERLLDLDKVDVIISTWSDVTKEQIDLIYKYIPHATVLTTDSNKFIEFENAAKMYYHWKNAINHVDETKYEKVILHRTDTVSNWQNVLNYKLEEDTLYLNDAGDGNFISRDRIVKRGVMNHHWIDDQFIFGNMNIIKKFINYIEIVPSELRAHFRLGNIILEHNIPTISWHDFIKISSKIVSIEELQSTRKGHLNDNRI
jgi:hypothetical protein|tara:strand:+ start:4796 stop:5449 length:654 start_codon:yes stop_codon:yes gene_type:complete